MIYLSRVHVGYRKLIILSSFYDSPGKILTRTENIWGYTQPTNRFNALSFHKLEFPDDSKNGADTRATRKNAYEQCWPLVINSFRT